MKKFFKNIYSKLIKKIFDLLYSELKIADQSFIERNLAYKEIKLEKNAKKKYIIYLLKNSRIYSDLSQNVAYIKKNFLLPKISIQLENNHLVGVHKNSVLKTGTKKFIQKKLDGNVLSLVQGISAINNYGHWMMDILPKLCIVEKFKSLNKFDHIYLPNIKKEFQINSLKYFKIDNKKFIDGSNYSHIKVENLFIPQHPYWELNKYQMETVANVDKDIINLLREKFSSINNFQLEKKKFKIFIDRSDSPFLHSQIENYNELIIFLKKLDFKILKLTKLSFEDQISYFKNANFIIGAHGAGLTNTIYCNAKTNLIEFSNKEFICEMFKNISKINKMNYIKIKSTYNIPKDRSKPDIFVNLDNLEKIIRELNK